MEILVPTKINDITLEEYQKFAAINTEDNDDDFVAFKTIEIFCGLDLSIVSKMPLKDAEDISKEISDVLNQTVSFQRRFELDGVEYGFLPKLDEMTLGEYIDLEEGLKDTKDWHKAAAVMYRPIKKKFKDLYTIEEYTGDSKYHEVMKRAPLGEITQAVVFFYNIVSELLEASKTFLLSKEMERFKTILLKDSSPRGMAGLTVFTHLLGEMLPDLNKSLDKNSQ